MAEALPDPGRVFAALADARRRELLELLAGAPGTSAGVLAAMLPVSRQAVASIWPSLKRPASSPA